MPFEEESDNNEDATDVSALQKKKRKKKKTKKPVEAVEQDDEFPSELLHQSQPQAESSSKPDPKRSVNLLRIDKRHLNNENEQLVAMYKDSRLVNKMAHSTKRRGHDQRKVSSHLMVNPKHWNRLAKIPMTMELESKGADVSHFKLVHKPEYQMMQQKLLESLESPDPSGLIALLQMYPTHAELLLQVSDLVHGSDKSMSAELVERAVSCFESIFHPRFVLSLGYCRLDYRRNENRPFFVSMFKHVCALGQKSCYRTALEVCKVLLTLDPIGDPLAVIHMIDFYALMSNQTDFLISLYDGWKDEKKLHLLPNFSFSIAFAHFKKSMSQKQTSLQSADQLLQEALLRFPSMLSLLLDKCSVEPDSSVMQSGIFDCSVHQEPVALRPLLLLYAERSAALWSSDRENIHWLERNVRLIIDGLEASRSIIQANKDLLAKYYKEHTPRNILRHILLTNFKDTRSCLPPDVHSDRMYAFDPLPPVDAIKSYEIQLKKPASSGDASILGLFLQSWLPDFDLDAAPEPAEQPDCSRLKSSISNLMDAMKNLLSTTNQRDDDDD